ncbi:hypothetical protein N7476_011594 [Penicillium atrosanguineum]|uniref:FAD-binding domain-containing protein n=1 Tax=Penicillium atrosanguineum TaxID=1132637 RepID=A0A9W9PPT6_9EURO|nr:hypothetical protein N7476_011594 [Penicillium atrosanguineum]
MERSYDVIIAGGGPVGLFVACELGQAGHSVLVLEREVDTETALKSGPMGFRGLNGPSVEALYRRGLLDKIDMADQRLAGFNEGLKGSALAIGKDLGQGPTKSGVRFGGHFASITLDPNLFEPSRFKYRIVGPSYLPAPTTIHLMETTLGERAETLGVTILRDHAVTDIVAKDDHGITVRAGKGKGEIFRGRWLVGCDGAHSLIRRLAAFRFEGTEPTLTGYTAHCEFEPADGLKKGFHVTGKGMYINDVPGIVHILDPDGAAWDRTKDITPQHFQDCLDRVTRKTDVKITKIHNSRSWTDRTKQVTEYRKGRVLLAGDAAHTHSPLGGQGLNLGLGDAVNLGWKLAATVRQEKRAADGSEVDTSLLDTYDRERRTYGEWLLGFTRVQVVALQPDLYGAALLSLIRELATTTDWTNLIMGRTTGLTLRYDVGVQNAHPLVGCSAPDFELQDGSRLGPMLGVGKGLLVDLNDDPRLRELVVSTNYQAQVAYRPLDVKDSRDLQALLIRPDGIVVWAVDNDETVDLVAAKTALKRWFEF